MIQLKVTNSKELGKFLDIWAKELAKPDKNAVILYDGVGNKIRDLILDEIPRKLGQKYGGFMWLRTEIEVVPTQTGFHLKVYGLKESEVDGGKVGANGQDYNLWAMHEFGRDIPDRRAAPGKSIAIVKDAASVAVVRQLARGFKIEGKRGAIQALVHGLTPRIERMVAKATAAYYTGKIAKSAQDAARKSKIKGNFSNLQRKAKGYGITDLDSDLIDIVETAINGKGQVILQGRNLKGQFAKKLGVTTSKTF